MKKKITTQIEECFSILDQLRFLLTEVNDQKDQTSIDKKEAIVNRLKELKRKVLLKRS